MARHISVVECLHDRTRLLETKQVALACCAQAILPLVCQVSFYFNEFEFFDDTKESLKYFFGKIACSKIIGFLS